MTTTTIKVHENLHQLDDYRLGWLHRHTPVGSSNLPELSCIEVKIEGLREDSVITNEARDKLDSMIRSMLEGLAMVNAYLLVAGRPATKNRIRTYKGLFPRAGSLRNVAFEKELEWDGETYFLGVATINAENIAEGLRWLHRKFSIVILSPIKSAESLWQNARHLIRPAGDLGPISAMSLPRLVAELVSPDQTIIKFGGGGAAGWLHFCVFVHPSNHERYLGRLEQIVAKSC